MNYTQKSGDGAFSNAIFFFIYPIFLNSGLEHGTMAKGKAKKTQQGTSAILNHEAPVRVEMIEEIKSLILMEPPYQFFNAYHKTNIFIKEKINVYLI